MTKEEKRNICDNIFEYIKEDLSEWLDDEIFVKTSMEQLGELYYKHTQSSVVNATEELLNAVIRTISPKNVKYNNQTDYYCALCNILHIKELPSLKMINVEKEYEEVFEQKYNLLLTKYQAEMNRIQGRLFQIKLESDAIKNATPSYSFMRDISTDESKLYALSSECNSLRTRKEMLEFAMGYVQSKLEEFCNVRDVESIWDAKKRESLKLSKIDTYGVEFIFSSYRDYIDIVEDEIDRPYALFFKVKLYVIIDSARKNYHFASYTESDEKAIEEYKKYLSAIPPIDDLYSYKSNNPIFYNECLEKIITDYNLIDELTSQLNSSVCLRERKSVLNKAVELYKRGEFEIFNNILPIQIEGMFADYLRDTTTFSRFTKISIYDNADLRNKIGILQTVKSNIYPEAVEYFMYYFNNMIRNRVAHGRYRGNLQNEIEDEIFAKELILDTCTLVHMLSRKSETEKMHRFIHGYQDYYRRIIRSTEHPCFGALFNDLIGDKLISEYDTMEKYRPIQVVYWIVNPYYEKIYEQVEDML